MYQSSMTNTAQRAGIAPLARRLNMEKSPIHGVIVATGQTMRPGPHRELICTCATRWNGTCDLCKQQRMPKAASA